MTTWQPGEADKCLHCGGYLWRTQAPAGWRHMFGEATCATGKTQATPALRGTHMTTTPDTADSKTSHTDKARQLLAGTTHADNPERDYADCYPPSAMDLRTATVHALLAIADAIHTPPAGTCTAIITTTLVLGPGADPIQDTYGCRHPHGHTGAHQDSEHANTWTDNAEGAAHLDNPVPNATEGTRCRIGNCILDIHHTGECIPDYPEIPRCDATKRGNTCRKARLHSEEHVTPNGQRWGCGHENPSQITTTCTEHPNHHGLHDNGRRQWPNDTYPRDAGPCIDSTCKLCADLPS